MWAPGSRQAWQGAPQTILVPDKLDERERFNCFYGMPTQVYGGIYWGALWCFKMNTDIHVELAYSRDGVMTAGTHSVRIEFYAAAREAVIQFKIEQMPQTFND